MKTRVRLWLLSLVMLLTLAPTLAQGVSARALADDLPVTKEPTSAKFDVKGSITSKGMGEDVTIEISGVGQMAKDKLQLDMTLAVPDLPAAPGSPNSFTISMITLDQKLYFKMTGLSTKGEDKWYVSDLSDAGLMPGMGMGMTGLDPALADVLTVTEMGKEAINGAPTTKYKVEFDLKKLNDLSGGGTDPATTEALDNATMMMYMWVGDNDTYLHQMRLEMDVEIVEPSGGPSSQLLIDLTMTFKEFDQPVNIVAPANAEPLDLIGSGVLSGIPGGSIIGMPIGTGMGMTRGGMGMGMPRSGSSDYNLMIALTTMGLMLVISGRLLRRRAALARVS
ncbi:MAG: hypothetical protein ABIO92_06345 [Chloroflexia bacterium]